MCGGPSHLDSGRNIRQPIRVGHDAWQHTDHDPVDIVREVFTSAGKPYANHSLHAALECKGGNGLVGATQILL